MAAGDERLATLRSYLTFYVVTSLWWDMARPSGMPCCCSSSAAPILRVMRRFRSRFRFEVVPTVLVDEGRAE